MRIFLANLRRLVWIARVLLAHGLSMLLGTRLTRWSWLRWLTRRLPPGDLPRPERLRRVFEELGGTFLKLGQMLALQPDILSLEYCNALFNLMDRVPPFAFDQVEVLVRTELGVGVDEAFEAFERQPLATASIGQVHRAMDRGRKVAVKVQRPNVEVEFRGDIRLMRLGISLIQTLRLKPLAWLVDPLSEFVGWSQEELDYRYEARYLERLRANARDNPAEHVPEVVMDRSARRVLTVEFLDGITVLDYLRAQEAGDEVTLARVRAGGFEPTVFARNIIDNFLGDAFRFGMFHADLHPANLMILPDNVVGYIDFGITAVLSSYSRRHLIELTLAYTRGDMDGMCAAFFKVSSLGPASRPEAFEAGLRRLADDWYVEVAGRRRLRKNFTLVMLDMLTLSRATGVLPERDVVKYIRSAIAIDGLITRFASGFDVGRYLEQVCGRHLRLQGLQASLGCDRLLDWSVAGAHLLRDGPLRGGALLDRLLSGDLPIRADVVQAGGGTLRELRRRAARLSVFLAGTGLLIGMTPGHLQLGVNPLSAAALLFASALAMLVDTVRRLA